MTLKTKKNICLAGFILSAAGIIAITISGVFCLVVIMDAEAYETFFSSWVTCLYALLIGYYITNGRDGKVSIPFNIAMNVLFYVLIILMIAFLVAFIRISEKIKSDNYRS